LIIERPLNNLSNQPSTLWSRPAKPINLNPKSA